MLVLGLTSWPGSCECVSFGVVLLSALFFALLFFALPIFRLIKIRKGYKPIHASVADKIQPSRVLAPIVRCIVVPS